MDIHITPKALEKLNAARMERSARYIRIGVVGGGCSGFQYSMTPIIPETIGPLDKVFHQIVVIDGISGMYLDGATLDYTEDMMQSGFVFNNPKATSTCGCGSSFSA